MPDKPTAEQVAEARVIANRVVMTDCVAMVSPAEVKRAFRVLLDAMDPPTDEELDAEAQNIWPLDEELTGSAMRQREYLREVYCRGARREGKQRHAKP